MSLFTRTKYITLIRRGTEIVLPENVYTKIQKQGLNVSLVKNPNSCTVQLTKSNKYVGTLKSFMNVSGFKNGNCCDFHKSNVIK